MGTTIIQSTLSYEHLEMARLTLHLHPKGSRRAPQAGGGAPPSKGVRRKQGGYGGRLVESDQI